MNSNGTVSLPGNGPTVAPGARAQRPAPDLDPRGGNEECLLTISYCIAVFALFTAGLLAAI